MKTRIQRIKKIVCATAIVLLTAGGASAQVLTFTDANAYVATVDVGTLEAISEPADNSVLTSLSYTVSGLTIDADGTANDTVSFNIPVSALGTGNITWDTNGGEATDAREFDYDNKTINGDGEGISFGVITVSGTGSGGQGYVLNSALYKEATLRRWTTDTADIVGDVTNVTGSNANPLALNDTSFSAARNVGNWNFLSVDFTVDVSSADGPPPTDLSYYAGPDGLRFDLTGASTTLEVSQAVDESVVSDLIETFGDNFKVSSTNGDFTEIFDGVWAIAENGIGYEFSEHTGLITVKPVAHWMSGGLGVGFRFRPHDVAETQGWVMDDTVAGVNSIPGVRWVLFNLTDPAGGSQFLAPHSVLSELDTQLDSPVFMPSQRELFEEALDRFQAEGYKVIVYYATQGPALLKHGVDRAEDKVSDGNGGYTSASMDVWADYVEGVYGDSSRATLLRAHAEIVFAEYAARFGDRIDGWWFDQTQDGDNQLHYEIAKQHNPNTVVGMDSSPNIYNDYLKGHVSGENAADVSNLEMYVHPAEASPEGYVYSDEGHPNISHYFSPVGESYNGGDVVWTVDQAADWTERMLSSGGSWTWNFDLIDRDFGTIRSDMLDLAIAAQEQRAENSAAAILGDCNLDGVVDLFDIGPFIGLLTADTFLEQADCNQDGDVNLFDIGPFITILTGG